MYILGLCQFVDALPSDDLVTRWSPFRSLAILVAEATVSFRSTRASVPAIHAHLGWLVAEVVPLATVTVVVAGITETHPVRHSLPRESTARNNTGIRCYNEWHHWILVKSNQKSIYCTSEGLHVLRVVTWSGRVVSWAGLVVIRAVTWLGSHVVRAVTWSG